MSWRNDPKIRALAPYAKRHGYATIVVMAVREGADAYEITTYGRNAALCKAAAVAGDQLHDLVQAGTWPHWPDTPPTSTRGEQADAFRAIAEDVFPDRDPGGYDPLEVVGVVRSILAMRDRPPFILDEAALTTIVDEAFGEYQRAYRHDEVGPYALPPRDKYSSVAKYIAHMVRQAIETAATVTSKEATKVTKDGPERCTKEP